jgi:hypothetical protein
MSPALVLIEYLPSKSVCAPVLVPLITTVTPGKLPELSDTYASFFKKKIIAIQTNTSKDPYGWRVKV